VESTGGRTVLDGAWARVEGSQLVERENRVLAERRGILTHRGDILVI
jgi:hypothetical protein